MSNNTVQVDVVAQVSGAVTGMRDLSLAVKQLQSTLRDSTGGFDQFGNAGSRGFQRAGEGAKEGAKGISSISDRLREYRKEETQQGRSTRFFAQELASLLPIGNDVAGMFGRVAGALAGGIGIGLAFEGLKLAAEVWTEHTRKAEEFRKSMRDVSLDTSQALSDMTRDFGRFRSELTRPLSASQKMAQGQLDGLDKEQQELDKKYRDQLEKRTAFRGELAQIDAQRSAAGLEAGVGDAAVVGSKIRILNEALREYDARTAAIAKRRGVLGSESDVTTASERTEKDAESLRNRATLAARYGSDEVRIRAQYADQIAELDKKTNLYTPAELGRMRSRLIANRDEDIARAREQRASEHSAFMRQQETANASEIVRINAEAEGKLEELATKYAQAQRSHDAARVTAIQQEMAAVIAAANEKIRLYSLEADAKLAADRDAAADADRQRADSRQRSIRERGYTKEAGGDVKAGAEITRLEEEYRQRINLEEGNLDEQLRLQAEFAQRKSEIIARSKHDWTGLAQTMGSSVGQALMDLTTHTKNFGQALANVIGSALREVIQYAMKSVMASAVVAAGRSAESQAGIPVIGPALAIGAMAAMFAAVSGLTANLSAAKGYDIPSGMNPVVQTHQREMILPEEHADTIRSLKGRAGGGGANITVVAWDHRDARRWFESPEGQEALGAGLSTRTRNGG